MARRLVVDLDRVRAGLELRDDVAVAPQVDRRVGADGHLQVPPPPGEAAVAGVVGEVAVAGATFPARNSPYMKSWCGSHSNSYSPPDLKVTAQVV